MDAKAIALKIVPLGDKPLVGELRESIAKWVDWAVKDALDRQREAAFPELKVVRQELAGRKLQLEEEDAAVKKKHRAREAELDTRAAFLKGKEQWLADQERRLKDLVAAFEAYAAWMEGDGEVDENGKRFEALKAAYKAYKGAKQ